MNNPSLSPLPPPPRNTLPRPDNHLPSAILVTCLCCMPFGIVAIVMAAGVDSAWDAGDREKAYRDSERARQWVNWSILAGLASLILSALVAAFLHYTAYH